MRGQCLQLIVVEVLGPIVAVVQLQSAQRREVLGEQVRKVEVEVVDLQMVKAFCYHHEEAEIRIKLKKY